MDKIQEAQMSIAALEQMLEDEDMNPDQLHEALEKLDMLLAKLYTLSIDELNKTQPE